MATRSLITIFTIIYCVAMVVLSYVVGKATTKDETEFMVGGREFNALLTAIGNGSILISGGYLPSIVMYGYMFGMGGMWYYFGWGSGALVALLCWAGFWRTSGALTPTEWFEYRYGKSGRLAITFVILFAAVASLAWQYLGCGDTMGAVLGISPKLAMIIVGAVVTLYVVFGGIWAATATDLFQFSWVFLIQFIILPIYLIVKYGWPDTSILPADFMSIFGTLPIFKFVVPSVLTFLMMHQSLLNQAQYWARAAGTRSLKDLKIGWAWTVVIAFFTGIVGAFCGCYARQLLGDSIVASTAFGSLMNILPPILAACMMAGLMAATMSTCDIVLVSSVNQLVRDIAQSFLKIKDSKTLLNWAKWGTIIYSAFTIVFAILWKTGISTMFAFGTGISAPLFIYYLDSWLLRVGNRKGCIASVVVSMIVVVYWEFIAQNSSVVNTLWLVFPISFVVLVVVSLLTKNDPVEPVSVKTGPSEFQIEILKAIRRGYDNTGAIIANITQYANEHGKQAADAHRALDSLELGGYVKRKGRRLIAQLYFSLTDKGEAVVDTALSAEERNLVTTLGIDEQSLNFMQWIFSGETTFSQISSDHGIYMLELSAISEHLQELGLVKVYGLTRLRAKLTEKGQQMLTSVKV